MTLVCLGVKLDPLLVFIYNIIILRALEFLCGEDALMS